MFDGTPTPHTSNSKIIPLFIHPAFNSILYPEDDILKIDPASRHELYAQRIIAHWESFGLRRPQKKNRDKAYGDAISDLVAVMKGHHPRLPGKKLSVEQIMLSITHWSTATFDPNYLPIDKRSFRALDIPRFVYSPFNDTSYLIEFLNPPKPVQGETSPKLTLHLMKQFSYRKWGEIKNNVESCHRIHFIRASNRLHKYLIEHDKEFQPAMGLSSKNFQKVAEVFMTSASKSSNWNDFKPEWLSNDFTFSRFDLYLHNQGFFKPVSSRPVLR